MRCSDDGMIVHALPSTFFREALGLALEAIKARRQRCEVKTSGMRASSRRRSSARLRRPKKKR